MQIPALMRLLGGVALTVLATAAATLAVTGLRNDGGSTATATANPGSFSVLLRPADSEDRPSRAVELLSESGRAVASASRRARLGRSDVDVRVLPGGTEVCVVAELPDRNGSAGYSCLPWSLARAGQLHLTLSGGPDQPDGEMVIVGLVPDNARQVMVRGRSGTARALPISEGFFATTSSDAAELIIRFADGERTIHLGRAPGQAE